MTASSDLSRGLFGWRLARVSRPRARARAEDRTGCAVGLGLLLAALIPPVLLAVSPGQVAQLGPGWIGQAIGALLVLLPAASGLAAARPGLRRLARRWRARPDKEHELAVGRVGVVGLLFVHAAAGGAGIALTVAAVAAIAAWGWLLALILRPDPSGLRLRIAMTADIALLSAFLAAGDSMAACWWPVYLVATFYAGYRFGMKALTVNSAVSVVGFAAVAASTAFWHSQPVLSAGLGAALLVLPACFAMLLRVVSAVRAEAEAARATRVRALARIGEALRRPDAPAAGTEDPALAWAAHSSLAEIGDIVVLSQIESGALSPSIEAFDLHAVIKQAIRRTNPEAVRKGLDLSLRVDPTLPFQLRAAAREVAQIAEMLVHYGVDAAESGSVRLLVSAASEAGRRLWLRLSIEHPAGDSGFADPERAALRLVLATRLAELIGGSLAEEPGRITALLPATLDRSPPESVLDLAGRPVLLATEDSRLAGELAEPLGVWRGDVRWIGGGDAALAYLDRLECRGRPILLADGRSRLLAALSFVQRAAAIGVAPPFIFLVAEPAQAAGLNSVLDDELDGVVPAPVEPAVLANALRVLPLEDDAAVFGVAPPPPVAPEPRPWDDDDRVTAISEHPRFAPEAAPVIDVRAIEALRALDGDDAFLAEVIDSFAGETRQLLERAERAARAGDAAVFVRLVEALRGCAANLGGVRLCEVAALLRPASGDDLRANGVASVERLAAEATRLHAALLDLLPAGEARRQ